MKKIWTLAVVGLLTAVFALGAVACSDDDEDDDGGEPTAVETMADETPMDETPMDGETPEAMAPIEVTVEGLADSGVEGSATIEESASGGVEVVVDVTAGLEEGSHQSHIHHGTCADPTGPIHVNLESIEAGADGNGSATTTDPADADGAAPEYAHYTSSEHYIAVHALTGEVVGCADIPLM